MTHKYTLKRDLAKDLQSWLPDDIKVTIPEGNVMEWIATEFNKRPCSIDPERTLKVFDMWYGLTDGVPQPDRVIGKQFDRTAGWVYHQRQKVLIVVSRSFR